MINIVYVQSKIDTHTYICDHICISTSDNGWYVFWSMKILYLDIYDMLDETSANLGILGFPGTYRHHVGGTPLHHAALHGRLDVVKARGCTTLEDQPSDEDNKGCSHHYLTIAGWWFGTAMIAQASQQCGWPLLNVGWSCFPRTCHV